MFGRESANQKNSVFVDLAGTQALSRSEITLKRIYNWLDQVPYDVLTTIKLADFNHFNGAHVATLIAIYVAAAKHIDSLVVEAATAMIVSRLVKNRQIAPFVLGYVINLAGFSETNHFSSCDD